MWDTIVRFASDKLDQAKGAVTNELKYAAKQLRDNVAVPAIDAGMEAGVIPAEAGMFGRYLTGTEKPLTKAPPTVKAAEAKKAEKLSGNNVYQERKDKYNQTKAEIDKLTSLKDESIVADEAKIKDLLSQQNASGIDIRNHRMGVGPPQDPAAVQSYVDREKQIEQLQSKWPSTYELGAGTSLSTDASKYNAPATIDRLKNELELLSNYKKFKGATPSNYTSDIYTGQEHAQADGTTNTLGRYEVKDGVITDRYDFDYYQAPGGFNTGGIVGVNDEAGLKDTLTRFAGGVADKLGLIRPGAGYDIRIKVR